MICRCIVAKKDAISKFVNLPEDWVEQIPKMLLIRVEEKIVGLATNFEAEENDLYATLDINDDVAFNDLEPALTLSSDPAKKISGGSSIHIAMRKKR